MGLRTPLYDMHVAAGARIVDFGGWDMPVNYGSQIEEHHAVRRDAGMFDVSHMCVVDLRGDRVRDFLRRLLANDVAKLTEPGKALYSCMLRDDGGVIDDLIVYYLNDQWYRMVVNAGTRDKDLAWLREHAGAIRRAVEPRRSRDDRGAGPACSPEGREVPWTRRSRRGPGSRRFHRAGRREPLRGAHRLHGRRRLGNHAARRAAPGLWARLRDGGVLALRPGRARHAAPRSGHESVRQRHGRNHVAAGIRPRLDRLPGNRRIAISSAVARSAARRPAAPRANSSACWWKSARAAFAPESHRCRRGRRRGDERHVFADARALDRLRARAGPDRRPLRGGNPRDA